MLNFRIILLVVAVLSNSGGAEAPDTTDTTNTPDATTNTAVQFSSGDGSTEDDGSGSATSPPASPSSSSSSPQETSSTLGIIAGVTIGVCTAFTLTMLFFFLVMHCYLHKDKVSEWNAVDYCIQEEYEAKINFDALDQLDPTVRAGIDMTLLASITHTDPTLLDKYKVDLPPPQGTAESNEHTPTSARSSISMNRSTSLHRISHECIEKKLSQTLQEAFKRNSIDGGSLRRVRTLSDVNSTYNARGSTSSITMMAARKDSQAGTTYFVERPESHRERHVDLLRVLSISTSNRPRSMTDVTHMRLEREDMEARKKEAEAEVEAGKEEVEETEAGKEEEEGGIVMRRQLEEAPNKEVEAANKEAEAQAWPEEVILPRREDPPAHLEAENQEKEAAKRRAAEEEIATQEALKEERAQQLQLIRRNLRFVMETPV